MSKSFETGTLFNDDPGAVLPVTAGLAPAAPTTPAGPVPVATAADLTRPADGGGVHYVDLPDGRRAFVRVVTLAELEEFQEGYQASGRTDFRARLIIAAACDEAGRRLFTLGQLADVRGMPGTTAVLIAEKIVDINGFSQESSEATKKNSETTTGSN